LADEGVKLFLTDIKDSETDLKRISEKYSCDYSVSDLGTCEGVDSFIDEVGFDFDIFVHTAGITGEKGDPLSMSEDGWADALNIDFLSAVRLGRYIGPNMLEKKWGRMVFDETLLDDSLICQKGVSDAGRYIRVKVVPNQFHMFW